MYKDEYENEIKGKLSAESIEAYPEYKHAIKAGMNVSQVCGYLLLLVNCRNNPFVHR